jgi:hypothetical protein
MSTLTWDSRVVDPARQGVRVTGSYTTPVDSNRGDVLHGFGAVALEDQPCAPKGDKPAEDNGPIAHDEVAASGA